MSGKVNDWFQFVRSFDFQWSLELWSNISKYLKFRRIWTTFVNVHIKWVVLSSVHYSPGTFFTKERTCYLVVSTDFQCLPINISYQERIFKENIISKALLQNKTSLFVVFWPFNKCHTLSFSEVIKFDNKKALRCKAQVLFAEKCIPAQSSEVYLVRRFTLEILPLSRIE